MVTPDVFTMVMALWGLCAVRFVLEFHHRFILVLMCCGMLVVSPNVCQLTFENLLGKTKHDQLPPVFIRNV